LFSRGSEKIIDTRQASPVTRKYASKRRQRARSQSLNYHAFSRQRHRPSIAPSITNMMYRSAGYRRQESRRSAAPPRQRSVLMQSDVNEPFELAERNGRHRCNRREDEFRKTQEKGQRKGERSAMRPRMPPRSAAVSARKQAACRCLRETPPRRRPRDAMRAVTASAVEGMLSRASAAFLPQVFRHTRRRRHRPAFLSSRRFLSPPFHPASRRPAPVCRTPRRGEQQASPQRDRYRCKAVPARAAGSAYQHIGMLPPRRRRSR